MRQIDADTLKTDVRRYLLDGADEFGTISVEVAERSFLRLVDKQPTIEAEPTLHGRWIPVTERMPEPKDNPVLVCHLGGVCIAWKLCNCWVLPSGIKTIEATHWMPLPEPPKMDGNADLKDHEAT